MGGLAFGAAFLGASWAVKEGLLSAEARYLVINPMVKEELLSAEARYLVITLPSYHPYDQGGAPLRRGGSGRP